MGYHELFEAYGHVKAILPGRMMIDQWFLFWEVMICYGSKESIIPILYYLFFSIYGKNIWLFE